MSIPHAIADAWATLLEKRLVREGLGDLSVIDREAGRVYITPACPNPAGLTVDDVVALDRSTGRAVADGVPSADAPMHLRLYDLWPHIGAIVAPVGAYSVAWAQTQRDIHPMGVIHANFFATMIPCTRPFRDEELAENYEYHCAELIDEAMHAYELDPRTTAACLLADRGPVVWGETLPAALANAGRLEFVAELAHNTTSLEPYPRLAPPALTELHYRRWHADAKPESE
jgi:L-ribulose-5-phosphate 4-epimerase